MKLQILSDQHVDFKQNFGYFANRCHALADTLIIAGDLHPHNDPAFYYYINNKLLPFWKNIILIPGNHEFYGSTAEDEFFGHKRKVYEHANGNKLYYVNNDVVEIDGVNFVCSTLWSHVGYAQSHQIKFGVSDYSQIKGNTIDKNNQRFKDNCKFLEETVSSLDSCVVVTHHLPSFSLISDMYRGHTLNEAFAANMDNFIGKHGNKVKLWIHGHSHDFQDKYLGDIRFVRNPMGYPQERHCDMDFVLDIDV
jgi:predicted phosphodiesterase